MLNGLSTTQKGILSAFAGFWAFAFADACSKWLGEFYAAKHIIFWVYYLAVIFGLILSQFLGGLRVTMHSEKLPHHILRGVCALATGLLVVTALSKGMALSTMYTILFLAPFLTTIAAIPIYKEHVTLKNWGIIAIGFSGILVAFHGGFSAITPEIVYVFAALLFIVSLGLLARPLAQETLLSLSLYPSLVIVSLLAYYVWPDLEVPALEHWPVFMLNGLCAIVGLSGIAYGFRHAPYAIIAPIHYSQMVIALVLGYVVFGDLPDFWMMTGASIIIVSGIMLIMQRERD